MRLLLDNDALCKLGLGGVLKEAAALFGAKLSDCGRLPALPYMLKKGRMNITLGPDAVNILVPLVESISEVPTSGDAWLDRLVPLPDVDPGEAQLLALAAGSSVPLISGDKRALAAVKGIPELATALRGHIAPVEAVLFALCDKIGAEALRGKMRSVTALDKMMAVVFSPGNDSVQGALASYVKNAEEELAPLVLWRPAPGSGN